MNEVLRLLTSAATPDAEFGIDLEALCDAMWPSPDDPWHGSIELSWLFWRG